MDELRARTNPAFNAAKSTLVYLMKAGDKDAAMMAGELHIDPDEQFGGEKRDALSLGMMACVDAYHEIMDRFLAAAPEKTVVDLGCGYTPRALRKGLENKRFIGCDLPIVIDEMAPLIKKLLAGKNRPAPAEYRAADFTSYASLRSALDGVEGPLCLTSEGTLAYLTQSEVRQLCANVGRVLREFGGRLLTPDPEANKRTIGTLRAVMGEEAIKNMMSAYNTLSAQSDVTVGDNDLVVRSGAKDGFEKAAALLAENGLKAKLLPIGGHMPELKVFAQLDEQQRENMKKLYAGLTVWEITPDPAWKEPVRETTGGAFALRTDVDGDEVTFTLRGRVDSLTAPEFLAAFEKAADAHTITDAKVDMSHLEYISSAGLRVLLIMTKRLGMGHVTVTGASELILSIFEQTGYNYVLTIK